MNKCSKKTNPSSQIFADIPLIKGSHMAKPIWERVQKDREDTERKILSGMVYGRPPK